MMQPFPAACAELHLVATCCQLSEWVGSPLACLVDLCEPTDQVTANSGIDSDHTPQALLATGSSAYETLIKLSPNQA